MSNAGDFVIENGVLKKYVGPGGDVVVPEGVTGIEANAFRECLQLTGIALPDSVICIGDGAFLNCTNLKKLSLSKCLHSIGKSAFEKCEALKSISLPAGITSIQPYTFSGCCSLMRVVLPENLVSIDSCAFRDCSRLKRIVVPKSVASIKDDSFSKATEELVLCGNQLHITSSAFSDYPALKSIVAPEIPLSEFVSSKLDIKAAQGFIDHSKEYTCQEIIESYKEYIKKQKLHLQPKQAPPKVPNAQSILQSLSPSDQYLRLYKAACRDGEAHINYPFVSNEYYIKNYRKSDSSDFAAARNAISKIGDLADAALDCWDKSIKKSTSTQFFTHELFEAHYRIAFAIAIAIKVFLCPDVRIMFSFDSSKWTPIIERRWVLSPDEPAGRVCSDTEYAAL